jgi:hypothetical protein
MYQQQSEVQDCTIFLIKSITQLMTTQCQSEDHLSSFAIVGKYMAQPQAWTWQMTVTVSWRSRQ